jgi:hypothetical protein
MILGMRSSFGVCATAVATPHLDRVDVLAALLGESPTGRDQLVEHARTLALRAGPWRYIEPAAGPAFNTATDTETGLSRAPQLYDLATDLGETTNLAASDPGRVARLQAQLEQIRAAGGTAADRDPAGPRPPARARQTVP